MRAREHRRRQTALVAVAILALLILVPVLGVDAELASLGPAVFAFLLLWMGRYPGEAALVALAAAGGRRWPRTRWPTRRRGAATMPRGGALIAGALAGRAPPALLRLV